MEKPQKNRNVDITQLAQLVQSIPTSSREGRGFEPLSSHQKEALKSASFRFVQAIFYIHSSATPHSSDLGHTTEPIEERLRKYNSNHKGFTGKFADWIVAYTEMHPSKLDAYRREVQVKKWKSRKKIEMLISHS